MDWIYDQFSEPVLDCVCDLLDRHTGPLVRSNIVSVVRALSAQANGRGDKDGCLRIFCTVCRSSPVLDNLVLQSLVLHSLVLHSLVLESLILHSLVLHSLLLHSLLLHRIVLHSIVLHSIVLHSPFLRSPVLRSLVLHSFVVQQSRFTYSPKLDRQPTQGHPRLQMGR